MKHIDMDTMEPEVLLQTVIFVLSAAVSILSLTLMNKKRIYRILRGGRNEIKKTFHRTIYMFCNFRDCGID